jgi:hypothetical protein
MSRPHPFRILRLPKPQNLILLKSKIQKLKKKNSKKSLRLPKLNSNQVTQVLQNLALLNKPLLKKSKQT